MDGMNIQELMSQAKKQYEVLQKKLQETVVEGTSGGGSVTVKMDGRKQVLGIKIRSEVVKNGDLEMLQDLITAAVNGAGRNVDDAMQSYHGAACLAEWEFRDCRAEVRFTASELLNSFFQDNFKFMSKFAEPMVRLIDELKKLSGHWRQDCPAAGVSYPAFQ